MKTEINLYSVFRFLVRALTFTLVILITSAIWYPSLILIKAIFTNIVFIVVFWYLSYLTE